MLGKSGVSYESLPCLASGDLTMCINDTGSGAPVRLVFNIFIAYSPIIILYSGMFTANIDHDKLGIQYESLNTDKNK